jgi:N-acetylmuramic acid 6-phosphate etherase
MRDKRLTEQRNPRSSRIDLLSSIQIVDLINSEDRTVALAVGKEREAIAGGHGALVRAQEGAEDSPEEGAAVSRVVGDLL